MSTRVFILAGILCACGGATPEPQHVDTAPTATETSAPTPVVHQELGSIDDRAVSNTFQDLGTSFEACQKAALKRLPYFSGTVKFFLRVGEDGKTKWDYVEQSTLGDFDAERCLLDAIEGAQWPKPIGGDATVERDLTFDPGEARQPADWDPDKVAASVGKKKKDFDKCVQNAPNAKFTVTAYVAPRGKAGKVVAAGVATSSKEGGAQVQCILDVVKALKLPSPGSYPAKVAFGL
ncbi:MAG TPA: hypothetical protein VGH28_03495 [Polyangiaceae bacterium]|jgi:hypothetical protein